MCGLHQESVWSLAVDGIYHHFLRTYAAQGFEPRRDKLFAGVVDIASVVGTALHEHGLYYDMAVEGSQMFYYLVDIVAAADRAIDYPDIVGIHGVELQYVVVYAHEGFVYLGAVYESSVAKHGNLGFRAVVVAQPDGVVNDFAEVGMTRRFAVARECYHVDSLALAAEPFQGAFETFGYGLARGTGRTGRVVGVVAAFAVYAVERAGLAVARL